MLLRLLLLSSLDYLLHMVYVVLLVFNHLLVALDLRLGPVLVGLDLNVLPLHFLVVLVQLDQPLVLILDLLP